MVFDAILNPIFSPLLMLPYLLSIILISFIISLLIVLIYKKFTDQTMMKALKDEIKDLQDKMKKLRDNPKEMMSIQKRAMESNFKYMMHSMKPTLITFIPILIIFGWLNKHMAYYPLVENQEFNVMLDFKEGFNINNTESMNFVEMMNVQDIEILNGFNQTIVDNKAKFIMKGKSGEYTLKFKYLNENNPEEYPEEYTHDIIITQSIDDRVYKAPVQTFRKKSIKIITVSNEKILAFKNISIVKDIPWIKTFGWLGAYIVFSIIFSLGLRKLLKVY